MGFGSQALTAHTDDVIPCKDPVGLDIIGLKPGPSTSKADVQTWNYGFFPQIWLCPPAF